MGKIFRPGHRESSLLSKIESSKEQARRRSLTAARDHIETLGNAISMKLVENNLVETNNKNTLEEQIVKCIDTLCRADDFDVDYMVAPYRQLVKQPNVVSLYVTAYLLEKLIDHKCIVDIYGSDNDIYGCIHTQVMKVIPS
jgi:hypothetical protein